MEENTTMAVEMTADEFAKFKAFQQKQLEEQRQTAEKKMRENYREMVDDAIESMMPNLKSISDSLATYKKKVFDEFKAVIDIKEEMFKLNNKELDNQSHTFTNTAGTKRIVLGNYVTDGYLDTADDGIAKVKAYIGSLAKDDDSKALVSMVMRLLAKGCEGHSEGFENHPAAQDGGGVRLCGFHRRGAYHRGCLSAAGVQDIPQGVHEGQGDWSVGADSSGND